VNGAIIVGLRQKWQEQFLDFAGEVVRTDLKII
jgi:hypothetical protein